MKLKHGRLEFNDAPQGFEIECYGCGEKYRGVVFAGKLQLPDRWIAFNAYGGQEKSITVNMLPNLRLFCSASCIDDELARINF